MGDMATGAAGWHPDPSGRAHVRYWDGAAWSDQVAAWGGTWTDPIEPGPGRPDARLLNETALTIDYGLAGLEAPGRWPISDPAGTLRGSIIAEASPIDPRYTWRYLVLDPGDLVVLTVTPTVDGWAGALEVADGRGRVLGTFVFPMASGKTVVKVGGQVVAAANPFEGRGVVTFGPGWDVPDPVRLTDTAGTEVASVTNQEERTALRRFYGARKGTYSPDPARCRLELIRPAGLPEPLRSLTLAFAMVFADRVHDDRVQQRATND